MTPESRAIPQRLLPFFVTIFLFCGGPVAERTVDAPHAALASTSSASSSRAVGSFALRDVREKRTVSLSDYADKRAIVVVFIGTECMITNSVLPTLADLSAQYAAKGVQFLAVNANVQDTETRTAAHADEHRVPFPVLKDADGGIADRFGARRTPEAFVLDRARTIVYQGRVDDQVGIGFRRPAPTRRDLATAIDEVLAGSRVTVAETDAPGCVVARPTKRASAGSVTYARDVAPILQRQCQECHRPGQAGPMSLLTYEDAAAWAETIREVVAQKRMPPWHADSTVSHFANERILSETERATLVRWVDDGAPRGTPEDEPAPRVFAKGDWSMGPPDVVLTMPDAYRVPATAPKSGIPYQHFILDPHFEEDRWLVATDVKVGAAAVVHHATIYVASKGKFSINNRIGGAAPGHSAFALPNGAARRIPKGSKIMIQLHYTPNGVEQMDKTSVGLYFAKEAPRREVLPANFFNEKFTIPAGAPNQVVEASVELPASGELLTLSPHMHLRGKDIRVEVIQNGKSEVLLDVPHYDFNWQHTYVLAKPHRLEKGARLHAVAHFDNSDRNSNNPDPKADVKWGLQNWDEMLVVTSDVVYDARPGSKEMTNLELLNVGGVIADAPDTLMNTK